MFSKTKSFLHTFKNNFYRPPWKLREGNVLIRACPSFCLRVGRVPCDHFPWCIGIHCFLFFKSFTAPPPLDRESLSINLLVLGKMTINDRWFHLRWSCFWELILKWGRNIYNRWLNNTTPEDKRCTTCNGFYAVIHCAVSIVPTINRQNGSLTRKTPAASALP